MNKIVNYTERNVKNRLLKKCKELNIQCRKVSWENRVGAPDWLLLTCGGVFVELKSPTGKVSAMQEREHDLFRSNGVRLFVVYTYEDLDDMFEYIRGYNGDF